MTRTKSELLSQVQAAGQEHLLAYWDDLDAARRQRLGDQLSRIDFDLIQRLVSGSDAGPDWSQLAERAAPPRAIRLTGEDREFPPEQAKECGAALLRSGKIGMILVAGGQGTRLGFAHPKGMFPLGPLSERTLFQILIDRLRAVANRYGVRIPLYLMTSPATHDETVAFLEEQRRFGLAEEDLHIFCQGQMPAVDARSGKILLAERDSVFLSPDGHGGMLAALQRSGCLEDAKRRGLSQLFYGQIDNPLLQVCDPLLIGYHQLAGSEMTSQVVEKRHPLERVGNVVVIDGRSQIIEYSDLPDEIANRRHEDGSLVLWAGSIAVHVFDVAFLERTADQADVLPFHRAHKAAPYIDADGRLQKPASPNAVKFERFIFDLLPEARNAIVVEGAPHDVFAPVKNAPGSPDETRETSQCAIIARDRALLAAAGISVAPDIVVEVNPLWALDAPEAARKGTTGQPVTEPTYFEP